MLIQPKIGSGMNISKYIDDSENTINYYKLSINYLKTNILKLL